MRRLKLDNQDFSVIDKSIIKNSEGAEVTTYTLDPEKLLIYFWGKVFFLDFSSQESDKSEYEIEAHFDGLDSYKIQNSFEFYQKGDKVAGFVVQNGYKINFIGKEVFESQLEWF